MPERNKFLYNLAVLLVLYLNIIFVFAIIYAILDHSGHGHIIDHYRLNEEAGKWFDPLIKPLYFSAITLLSVGYGDVTPFGWARIIAVFEAMAGYVLPATVIIQYIRFFPRLPFSGGNLGKKRDDP